MYSMTYFRQFSNYRRLHCRPTFRFITAISAQLCSLEIMLTLAFFFKENNNHVFVLNFPKHDVWVKNDISTRLFCAIYNFIPKLTGQDGLKALLGGPYFSPRSIIQRLSDELRLTKCNFPTVDNAQA